MTALQPGGEPERAALALSAFGAGVAPHQLCQALGDGQAEPGSAVLARGRRVGLLEILEEAGKVVRKYSVTAVFHFKAHEQIIAAVRFIAIFVQQFGANGDRPAVGEFDGVAGVVEQRLAQARRVAAQPERHRVAVDFDAQPLVARRLADDRGDAVEDRGKREVGAFQLQSIGLDLRQIEDVVDDRKQVAAGVVDLVEALDLFRRRAASAQQVVEADDGVDRRADFVAHVGQEAALGETRRLGLLARVRQFFGAADDQLFEMVAMAVELLADTLLFGDVVLDRDVVRDASVGLAQRRDDGELDILAAVLAPVDELALPRTAVHQRFPHGGVGFGGRTAGIEQARILSDQRFARVTGVVDESLVNVLDARCGVGDDDALRTLFEGLRELPQFVLVGHAPGLAREDLQRETDVRGHFDQQFLGVVVKCVELGRVEHEGADGFPVPDQGQGGG